MSFTRFSSDFLMESFTLVDNLFVVEHLPYLEADEIKIYVYGLYLCLNQTSDNSIEKMASVLGVEQAQIQKTYEYFEDAGLVRIVTKEPLEVQYLSLKRANQPPKKFKAEKYADFNKSLQSLFEGRMLTPNELNEYYLFLDSSKMEQNAFLMIVQYCINLKGESVHYPYVLAVARNWASDGVKNVDDVERKLNEYEAQDENMREVLKALSRKGGAELEEKQMLLKWTRSWGFEMDAVIAAAKSLKGGRTFKHLDKKLDEFYRTSIFTVEEMKDYAKHREELNDLTIELNKTIGVFYESLDHEIEVYVVPWTLKGFSGDALKKIAHYCFLCGIRSLDGVNNFVNRFYTQGILTPSAIDEFVAASLQEDGTIRKVIEATGRTRSVTQSDRDFYRTWTLSWGFSDEIILYAASLSLGKTYPVPYVNQQLSLWHSSGVKTLEEAQKLATPSDGKKHVADYTERKYSAEELQTIFGNSQNFDNIEL